MVAALHEQLAATLSSLKAHIGTHGMIDGNENEILANGALALDRARETGLIARSGGFNPVMGIVPLDDETRDFADSMLTDHMIDAGMDSLDQVARDKDDDERGLPGERPDWDQGMIAVAAYRAMVRSSRQRTYACALEIDRGNYTRVQATGPQEAARVYALDYFNAAEGEWMGGGVVVLQMPLGDPSPELAFNAFGGRFDTTIHFPEDRDPHATAEPMRRSMKLLIRE